MVTRQIGQGTVRLASRRQSEIGIARADLGSRSGDCRRGFAAMDIEMAPVLLRDGEDRRQRPSAFELNEGVQREGGSDQAEFVMGAIQLRRGARKVAGGQRGQSEKALRMGANEFRNVVVLGPPEWAGLVRSKHAGL